MPKTHAHVALSRGFLTFNPMGTMLPSYSSLQVELGQLFLRVMRHVDALEGRFASAMGFSSAAGAEAMAQIEQRMVSLEAELSTTSARAVRTPLAHVLEWTSWDTRGADS